MDVSGCLTFTFVRRKGRVLYGRCHERYHIVIFFVFLRNRRWLWEEEEVCEGNSERQNLYDRGGEESTKTNRIALTDDKPTPSLTPRFRSSHQRNAPTSPAAPVPDAKYLYSSTAVRYNTLGVLKQRIPNTAPRCSRRVGGG